MQSIGEVSGLYFNIQRFSVHDGPGVRSIVFLKGCPLKCPWCANPESQKWTKQLSFNVKDCIDCYRCVDVCQENAITFSPNYHLDVEKCNACGKCEDICYPGALEMMGKTVNVAEIINELKRDSNHYRRSGGGITLSGGEAIAQPEFAAAILQASQQEGWHTAVETAGYYPKENLDMVLPHLDLVLMDIKHTNSQIHNEVIGKPNEIILQNARYIADYPHTDLVIRVPVIPGFNDSPDEIENIARFAESLPGVETIHLLPFHKMGESKYDYLQQDNLMKNVKSMSKEEAQTLEKVVKNKTSLRCVIGG